MILRFILWIYIFLKLCLYKWGQYQSFLWKCPIELSNGFFVLFPVGVLNILKSWIKFCTRNRCSFFGKANYWSVVIYWPRLHNSKQNNNRGLVNMRYWDCSQSLPLKYKAIQFWTETYHFTKWSKAKTVLWYFRNINNLV